MHWFAAENKQGFPKFNIKSDEISPTLLIKWEAPKYKKHHTI